MLRPARSSAATASGRTLEGPDPKRPSWGRMPAGIAISIGVGLVTVKLLQAMARISQRISAVAESATLAIDAKAKALKAAGEDVIGFGAGEPDFPTPEHIVQAAVDACRDPRNHKYTPAGGLPELKDAIAAKTRRDSGWDVPGSRV